MMPHVVVKLYAGRSEKEKAKLADEIAKVVAASLKDGEHWVSVGIEDVTPEDWAEKVFWPDLLGKPDTLYRKPGPL
jgi:4-oxalocrotonate tautomerase